MIFPSDAVLMVLASDITTKVIILEVMMNF